ncbi:MAG: HAMP domain-containing protein [Synergistaceae bacterium]|jgi:two-component system sensor histidine kinase CpxA|nr:HAMP domain-containing protein [Synergistaceae bacterium]
MKKITGVSLFWKIYLTLLLVLFLPIILFALSHIARDRDRDIRDIRQAIRQRMTRHLEWSASELANQADSITNEGLTPWIESIENAIGLAIYVQRDGEIFHLPDSDWLVAYEPDEDPFPPNPTVVSSVSRSGRTKVVATAQPFRGEDNADPRAGPRRRNIEVFLLVAVLCVAFSFMLVRNFMTPLSELRRITLKLASGDLSVRVGQSVIGRGDEIADLGRRFNKMAERVEGLVSSQKRLLSDISHEIRSPLQRMEVACALLRDKGDKPQSNSREYIDRIELEISRIDDMVEELLTLTRADETSLTRFEVVRLDEVINSIIADAEFERGADECGAGEKIVAADLQKVSVMGDATLLNRALRNVIHNAIRYTSPGTGIEINARRDGDRVTVTIRDHGQGVLEKDLDKIFLPYYRTDEARERTRGGAGLGLAITKRIVENYGGEVTASNAPFEGAPPEGVPSGGTPSGGLMVTISFAASEKQESEKKESEKKEREPVSPPPYRVV